MYAYIFGCWVACVNIQFVHVHVWYVKYTHVCMHAHMFVCLGVCVHVSVCTCACMACKLYVYVHLLLYV